MAADFYSKNKYTLVDFWYSHCGPCIAQFNDLKDIYTKYGHTGFDIIAISTDIVKYKADWQKKIQQRQLSCAQYWDINGVEASRLNINAFPTNLLLDDKGNIIKKNLRPVELADFLQSNL